MNDSQSQQAKRVVFMLRKLQNGFKLSAADLHRLVNENFHNVSLRTVQRDLRVLQDAYEFVETIADGKTIYYYIPRMVRPGAPVNIGGSDILSLHILKAHLKAFKGTVVEENAKELERKLEELAPSNVYASESLYWNKNIGQYDYSDFDKILRQVMHYIESEQWVKIIYHPLKDLNKDEEHICMFKTIFTYFGYLYVAAFDVKHKKYVIFAIHRIESIQQSDEIPRVKVPKFNYNNFVKYRFGVYGGIPKSVKLKIDKDYFHYFEDRFWHQTQKFEKQSDGSVIMKLKVPIGPDFVSWILSWGDAVTVLSPQILINKVKKSLEKSLAKYSEEKK